MWNSKKVTVNCKKNHDNDKRLTLVDNKYGEAHDFSISTDVLKYLLDEGFSGVENYIAELVEKKLEDEQEKRKWRTYKFYVNRDIGPLVINQFDGSPHVKNWEVRDSNAFGKNDIVVIEYVADKQILFQTPDGVAVEL